MTKFIAIQNTYEQLEIGCFQDKQLLTKKTAPKFNATARFIPLLQEILKEHTLTLSDIPFIAVNQGPGPFTTLRVVIASVNGLNFATSLPLVGINALQACAQESYNPQYKYLLILLNAFSSDVYYGLAKDGQLEKIGCDSIHEVLNYFSKETQSDVSFLCVGNAVPLYEKEIKNVFGSRVVIEKKYPMYSTLEQIGQIGLDRWENKDRIENQIMPIYLKKYPVSL